MKCEQIQELLSPYLDNMTSEKENNLIEAHLQECSVCREELDRLKFMCNLLHTLENPEIPDGFAEELHMRLLQEKVVAFPGKEKRNSKKPGWLVSSAAGIALALGIYASSILPFGDMVAFFENKTEKEPVKPPRSIEEMIMPIKIQMDMNVQQEGSKTPIMVAVVPEVNENMPDPGVNNSEVDTTNDAQVNTIEDEDISEPIVVVPKVSNNYCTVIRVDDIEKGIREIYQLADANDVKWSMPVTDKALMQAFDENNMEVIDLAVPHDFVQLVLGQLAVMGAATPEHDGEVLTQQYLDIETNLKQIQSQIQELEAKEELSSEETNFLAGYKEDEKALLDKKDKIDQDVEMVVIQVRLLENQ